MYLYLKILILGLFIPCPRPTKGAKTLSGGLGPLALRWLRSCSKIFSTEAPGGNSPWTEFYQPLETGPRLPYGLRAIPLQTFGIIYNGYISMVISRNSHKFKKYIVKLKGRSHRTPFLLIIAFHSYFEYNNI